MKKIIVCAIFVLLCVRSAYALDLDKVKHAFLKSEWKQAIRDGEALLAGASRDSENLDELYYYLAVSYMKDGNYLRASDICEIILREFKRSRFSEQAHYVLVDAYTLNKNYAQAQSQAEAFLKKYPDSMHYALVDARLSQAKRGIEQQRVPARAGEPVAGRSPEPVAVSDSAGPDVVLSPEAFVGEPQANSAALFWVQVGAFSDKRNANNLAVKLQSASYSSMVAHSISKDKDIFKVRVGPYRGRDEALAAAKKLGRDGYPTKIVP